MSKTHRKLQQELARDIETREDYILEPELRAETKSFNTDGGKNSFYEIPEWVKDVDDLCEYLELNFYMGNILKSLWVQKGKRHEATDEKREAKKRLHYSKKELNRLERIK